MKLNIGAGVTGQGDWKIDLHPIDDRTKVVDLAVEAIPFPDNYFDEVEAAQVLEHIPTQLRWREDGKWHLRYPRIEVMREIHRVLKPGGLLLASVPIGWPEWAQDPTHISIPWNQEQFCYFAGQWGGGHPGSDQFSYGITFKFSTIRWEKTPNEKNLTVWMTK